MGLAGTSTPPWTSQTQRRGAECSLRTTHLRFSFSGLGFAGAALVIFCWSSGLILAIRLKELNPNAAASISLLGTNLFVEIVESTSNSHTRARTNLVFTGLHGVSCITKSLLKFPALTPHFYIFKGGRAG